MRSKFGSISDSEFSDQGFCSSFDNSGEKDKFVGFLPNTNWEFFSGEDMADESGMVGLE